MSDNGHDDPANIAMETKVKGAVTYLDDMMRRDGILAEHVDKMSQQNMGVINRILTPSSDNDYRQILKLAKWSSEKETDLYCNALAVCDVTGATMARKILLDRITAKSSGVNAELIRWAIEGLTHTTFTTQRLDGKRRGSNNEYNNRPTSPLSQ